MPEISIKAKKSFSSLLLKWWEKNKRHYPWRDSHITPYRVIVAEVLLKRTTATAAQKTFKTIVREFPSLKSMAKAHTRKLERILGSVGLQKQRAKGLKGIALFLCRRERCRVPSDQNRLLKVPHIGSYTANAVLSFAFNRPYAIVDSNVIRVFRRAFHHELKNERRLRVFQALADRLLDEKEHRAFNWALLDLGAMVCHYSRPKHDLCPLNKMCSFPGNSHFIGRHK